jgi:hypothetical protein
MLVFFCLTLSACGKKSSSPVGTLQATAPSIQVNIVNGATFQFSAADLSVSGTVVWSSDDELIVTVDPSTGLATAQAIGVALITATSFSGTGSALVGVVSPNPGQAFTLSGKAEYEDKPFDQNGFLAGPPVPMPIRNALIRVIGIDGFTVLASGVTDNAGNYPFTAPIGDPTKRGGAYVQVISTTNPSPANPAQISIRNNLTDQALLSVISNAFDNSTGGPAYVQDVLALAEDSIGGAFNILDVFLKANDFLCPSVSPPANCPLPPLTTYWEPGSSEGTFFSIFGSQMEIFICGGGQGDNCVAGDSDEYDDAVIAHEYGHFALEQFSHDNSPGGRHGFLDNGQDIRLSWSEGWASFFSSAVRSSPLYVDTSTGLGTFFFDIEDPLSPFRPSANYTTSELSVAGILWDILDGAANPVTLDADPLDLTFDEILQTIMNIPLSSQATMESFWLAFEAVRTPTEIIDLQFILEDRQIELFLDVGDETVEQEIIVDAPAQHHTLYPLGDTDTMIFNVIAGTVYTLETLNLTNGADTFLTISNSGGIPIFTFDNQGGINYLGCGVNPFTGISTCPLNGIPRPPPLFLPLPEPLSSTNTWVAQFTETLSVEVVRAPLAPPSAGLFGSYDIRLTSP